MLQRIVQFSIKNKLIVGAFTLGLIVWGVYSALKLPIDAVPDITNNQVQIITQAPTLGAQEVEQFITMPIELEVANIPELIERRSISRSGISVITLVFKDDADIYWARTQVSERLAEASRNIPQQVGEPILSPITTGLGEIYQYVLHTKQGYEGKYSASDLRTLQDWTVKTQLAGTPGVAEISGWGGFVKQYEVAIDNDKLNSFNITVPEIFTALEKNNENTGGSYIEQRNNAYFIRGLGLVRTLGDIERIVVKNTGGIPILVRDVATVQYGNATRYGAVTRNGEGEVVGGVVLMLKGENFSEVITRVKERMVQIQKSLPEGVVIEPYIDRTELVNRAVSTVKKNLIEGALIVIFVLVLLLGNWRAGLVVASVIPLALLFAIGMMQLFGVSGNLMSLGAIDFGLIVDGAVIIVEAIIHRLTEAKLHPPKPVLNQSEMDAQVFEAASKIRQSAAFGEIIILIVYLPLLTLVGIEGKMFRPMAETVAFAILGAFILSLTYVPAASALFLSKKTAHRRNLSDRIMDALHRVYEPALRAVLRVRVVTVAAAFTLFLLAVFAFSRMGGEFIPTLEEGDLTVELSMMQGTSLTQSVETFTKAERILRQKFPEIKQAVSRIGSAEIPTDPMPFERGDIMVAMKPKEEWKTAHSREDMMHEMEEALSVLPGAHVEITQPMQMRFNELMTGIRQDVAVKLYGDDLSILTQQAARIAKLIDRVDGVTEPYVEKVSGLPQVIVAYNRDKIAQYGLSISDVNMVLKTAFAGNVAGVVFEGEKRFDLVIRLQRDLREQIANVENLFVPLPNGNKVPLNQLADISFQDAPAQVSREDGKRRIYVGFNVRGRDVESTVKEIQQIIDSKAKLPAGYYITYGGQFQNLKEAKARLSIAVPGALVLILLLLYITFGSLRQMMLIFTAVPLSAIGGVAALMLRGMPFSISAGVGFIALFGVAVLNGIVLIGYFNQLKSEGITDPLTRVMEGTKVRLRPVVMTAAVASLGFLPMALSTSAGAEVQKPLATVVIGGLISATFLTLFVLPCLYLLFSERKKQDDASSSRATPIVASVLTLLILVAGSSAKAQSVSVDNLIQAARQNNLEAQSAVLEVQQSQALQGAVYDLGKTNVGITQDPTSGGNIDNALSVSQSFAFPTFYGRQRTVLNRQTDLAKRSQALTDAEIVRNVKMAYNDLLFAKAKTRLLVYQDSIYKAFTEKATVRYRTGETNKLEQLTALNKYQEVQLALREAEADAQIAVLKLRQLTGINPAVEPADSLAALRFDGAAEPTFNDNPAIAYWSQNLSLANARVKLERARLLPEFTLGYSHQLIIQGFNPAGIERRYFPGTRIAGIQAGIGIPLFFGAATARIKAEQIGVSIAGRRAKLAELTLRTQYTEAYQQLLKFRQTVSYYQSTGLQQTDEQIRIAQVAFQYGEIGYMEFVQNVSLAVQGRLQYLTALSQYNAAIINLNFYKGTQ
ncbi:MAG: CusA/CzcA family heavy metal efflux RND transporter [Bacteroidetes bacterium]|nr:CusA/CzcA family heavy metal efflux RND transporter [Bacteroidota bacterium]